ncbi:MAG: tetratricopeptide repeat protein [Flavobacterium sp.]
MKFFLSALLLGVCVSGYSQTNYSYVYDTNAFMAEGLRLYEAKSYADAIKEFDKVDKNDPRYYNAQYEKALALAAGEDKETARKFYENAYATGMMAEVPDFYMAYGSFLSDAKEYEKAEKLFKEAEKHYPEYSPLLYNMALLYVRSDQRQKSVDLLERSIRNNPNHVGSHYLLGLIALEDGRVTEGTMALLAYLTLMPDGGVNETIIAKLNSKFSENFLEKGKLVFSAKGDDFSEIEEVLENGLALKSAYKVKSAFDDIIIRQVQAVVEYSADHKGREGFFETTYVPWLADMAKKNQFEGFSYHILLGMQDKLGKRLTTHNKKIKEFQENYLHKGFWAEFAKRKVDLFGRQEEVVVYLRDGWPDYLGKEVDGKKTGRFKILNKYGNIAAELNFADDELEGQQKYYTMKGKLVDEKNFSKGKLNGKRTTYFENGNVKVSENYKDDMLDGPSVGYYINGGKSFEGNYVADEREGVFTDYYENGIKQSEANYLKGELNGKYTYYDKAGNVSNEQNFVKGQRHGRLVEYYDGKLIKTEGEYDEGVIKGGYKAYFANGTLKEESIYANKLPQSAVYYYDTGKKSYDATFDKTGDIIAYTYYDPQGNKYFVENYKQGEIKPGLQFSANNPKPAEVPVNKGNYQIKTFNGDVLTDGKFTKGKKTGEWIYFYRNGLPKSKEMYENDVQKGKSVNYATDGRTKAITNYVNDTIQGVLENYDSGRLASMYHYKGGDANGPAKTFHEDGKLYSESFYIDGELYSKQINYWQNGKPSQITEYVDGTPVKLQTFNPDGTKSGELDYNNKSGKVVLQYNPGESHEYELKNGLLNGKYLVKEKDGKVSIEGNFINGVRHGKYLKNGPMGTPFLDYNYYVGKLNGESRFYDLAGNLRMTDTYIYGDNTGMTVRYYSNKGKISEVNQFGESKDGEMKYYNRSGQHIMTLGYDRDELMYYMVMDKAGKLTEKIPVKGQTAEIKSVYPNGKTAMETSFVKGNMHGKFIINNAEGKPEYEATYNMNLLNGPRLEYHANGKLYKKENFIDSSYEGIQEYFGEDGKPIITAEYQNDELHGLCKIYKAGVLSQTKRYDSNALVEIR